MATNWFRIVCAVVFLAGWASPARADLIVIDPNNYAAGTNLSTLFPGVTLSNLVNDSGVGRSFEPTSSSVFAISTYHDPTTLSIGGMGSRIDAYESCSQGVPLSCGAYNVLELQFEAATNLVAIDSLYWSDAPGIMAFDALGNRLYDFTITYTTRPDYTSASTITLSHATADISRIVYGGLFGTSTPTRITYNSVPEPMTLAFMGVGLAGAALYRRRRQRSRSN